MKKSLLLYGILILIFAVSVWAIVKQGDKLTPKAVVAVQATEQTAVKAVQTPSEVSSLTQVKDQLIHNLKHPLSLLLAQIIVIIIVSKVFGRLVRFIGQPTVVGEIIAGIVLGPSVFGLFFPEAMGALFPPESMKNLQFLSQIGLAFFMFIIGMELDLDVLKKKAHNAIVVSHASIMFPYLLGVGLSYYMYETFAPAGVNFLAFGLFMGIAMSITAFPVLAHIIKERKMNKTPIGMMAITCAAADDVTAWCILAVVIAIAKAGAILSALTTIILALGFVLLMLYVIKPLILRVSKKQIKENSHSKAFIALAFFVLMASAYIAEVIGIHALFGAFLAGVIMPARFSIKEHITEKIEDVSLIVLLPIFFAFTGLRTQIGLLNEASLWGMCGLIISIAVIGKFAGSALAAKFTGQSWNDSLTIGALMNTRGLMELVVLNIGYDLGILSPQVFAMMVLMALATTFMTGPSLDLIDWYVKRKSKQKGVIHQNS